MKSAPPGWPRCSSSLRYERASEAIDWLVRAFGFEVRLREDGDDGTVVHSELVYGGAVFMVADASKAKLAYWRAPSEIGGVNTQSLFVYVDDVDAHCQRAREASATIVSLPETHDYGKDYWSDRTYECIDCGGHHWSFAERVS